MAGGAELCIICSWTKEAVLLRGLAITACVLQPLLQECVSQVSPVAVCAGDYVSLHEVQQCCQVGLAGLLCDLTLLLQGRLPSRPSCRIKTQTSTSSQ
jgi:hypothetical protein